MNIYLKRAIIVLKVFAAFTLLFVLRPLEWLARAVLRGLRGFALQFTNYTELPFPSKQELLEIVDRVKEDWKG